LQERGIRGEIGAHLAGDRLAFLPASRVRSAAKAAGIDLLRVFEDSGVSAHNPRRPGLPALLATAEAGIADVVIVPDLSRLARDAGQLQRLRESLDKHGVRLVSADQDCSLAK
jgi:DNA invertase Pin-like site-specific DNA recombinase